MYVANERINGESDNRIWTREGNLFNGASQKHVKRQTITRQKEETKGRIRALATKSLVFCS